MEEELKEDEAATRAIKLSKREELARWEDLEEAI